MADKVVTIHADKERHLKFGINALVKLETEMGKPLAEVSSNPSMKDLRLMFKVGLYWEDRKITDEQVGDIMDVVIQEQGMEYLAELLADAMEGSMGVANSLPSK